MKRRKRTHEGRLLRFVPVRKRAKEDPAQLTFEEARWLRDLAIVKLLCAEQSPSTISHSRIAETDEGTSVLVDVEGEEPDALECGSREGMVTVVDYMDLARPVLAKGRRPGNALFLSDEGVPLRERDIAALLDRVLALVRGDPGIARHVLRPEVLEFLAYRI